MITLILSYMDFVLFVLLSHYFLEENLERLKGQKDKVGLFVCLFVFPAFYVLFKLHVPAEERAGIGTQQGEQ